jgi:hypothetical protein
MFRLTEPSSGQIQNIVLVQSVSAHYGITQGPLMCVAEFLILITNICRVY